MKNAILSTRILGVHPVVPTVDEFREAVEILCGEDLEGPELAEAESRVRDHFEGLYLIELHVDPQGIEFDWSKVTQPEKDKPPESWQAAYDERYLEGEPDRWAFFFHFLELHETLRTSHGDLPIPDPTPVPRHLESIRYEIP